MAQPPLFPDIQAIYSELIPAPPPLKFLNSPSAPLFLPDYTKCLLLTNRFHHRAPGDIDFHMVLNSVFTGRIKSGNGFKDNISPLHFYIDFPKLRFQGRREYAFRIFTRKNSWFAVPMRLVENIQPAGKTEEEAWRFADELGSTSMCHLFLPSPCIQFGV